ncbi:unnamed protein product [Lymnaea stagnalis]|uniref:Sulfotransferase domain-containing protein n=1 Tax=Lymnaea stagnalis TaxID=6523 RepID=A0AAV2I4U7_LYMST
MKTNEGRCIRLVLIWMALVLCVYFYDLHGRRKSTEEGAVPINAVTKTSGGWRRRDDGGAEREHEDDNIVIEENLAVIKDADGSHGNVDPEIELQEDVLPESLEVSENQNDILLLSNRNGEAASDIHNHDGASVDAENGVRGIQNRMLYFRDPKELGKNDETKEKGPKGSNVNVAVHTKSELSDPKKSANSLGAVARLRVAPENISTNVDFKTLTDNLDPSSNKVDEVVSLEDGAQGAPKGIPSIDTVTPMMRIRSKHRPWTISEMGKYSRSLFTPPPHEAPVQRFPKAIIIGAGKCGTRALLEFLRMHPYIAAANSEVHFFDLDVNFRKGLDWYKAQMPLSYSNQITIEKTPSYLWSQRAVEEIYKLDKKMKLMIIIKDPVTRAMSQATRTKPEHPESMFVENVAGTLRVVNESRTVDWGVYVKYIKMWLQWFPMSQIYVIESRQFVYNPAAEIQQIERFLGLPPMITERNFYYNRSKGFYCMRPFHVRTIQCLAPGKGLPHPTLEPRVRDMLYNYYHEHNEALFNLLGRRFEWKSRARL